MRRVMVMVVVVGALGVVPHAHADHRPKSYCSESGDVCQSVKKRDGVRRLNIGLAAKYFSRYKLCVTAPDESSQCISRKITDQGASYGDSVNWERKFGDKGAGDYSVIWRHGGDRLGRILGFHV